MAIRFEKAITDASVLTATFWLMGLITKGFKIPLVSVPPVTADNLVGVLLGLLVAVYVKDLLERTVLKNKF